MKLVLLLGALLLVAATLMLIRGLMLPLGHTTRLSRRFAATPEQVWARISAVADYPAWRAGVKAVWVDGERFVEEGAHGKIAYRLSQPEPGRKLLSVIDDPALPFSGSWTWELAEQDGGCLLTITEQGEVPNPIFRFLSHYVFTHEKTVLAYLDDLERVLK